MKMLALKLGVKEAQIYSRFYKKLFLRFNNHKISIYNSINKSINGSISGTKMYSPMTPSGKKSNIPSKKIINMASI